MRTNTLRLVALATSLLLTSSAAIAQTGVTYLGSNASNAYSASLGNYYSFNLGYSTAYLGLNMRPNNGGWTLGTDGGNNGGSMLVSNVVGGLSFITIPTTNPSSVQNLTDAQVIAYSRMYINGNGQVRVGLQAPSTQHNDYRLSVDGKLVAKSIYVTSPGTWADFVFEPTYQRLPLPQLESYLTANRHLPSMPAAQEVAAAGYSLSEMDTKLLQNVEELTLYVIELNKQNEALRARVTALESQAQR